MYQVIHNNGKEDINPGQTEWELNGVNTEIEIVRQGKDELTFVRDGHTYEIRVHKIDRAKKEIILFINGKRKSYQVKEPIDVFLSKLGIDTFAKQIVKSIKAPMPGLILKVLVQEGETIKEGDALLILEAMKMENVFKAPNDATVERIYVHAGQTVNKGQELILFK